jgi:hypothetical protein
MTARCTISSIAVGTDEPVMPLKSALLNANARRMPAS